MAQIVDPKLIKELLETEEKRLQSQTPKSAELYERAKGSLVKGVASSYQVRDPYPIYFTKGLGSRVWDADGREISDFHNGFGCMVQGHAHPAIVEAVNQRMALGSQFALPTEDSIVLGVSKMNAVLDINFENRTARVQTGITNIEISNAVAPDGCLRPVNQVAHPAAADAHTGVPLSVTSSCIARVTCSATSLSTANLSAAD